MDTGRQQSLVSPMSTLDTATAVEVQRPEDTAQPVDTPSTYPNPEGTGQDPTGARPPTTVSVDTMAEDLRDSLLRGMNEEIARLFSVDEYDGKFAQILKRFSLSFVSICGPLNERCCAGNTDLNYPGPKGQPTPNGNTSWRDARSDQGGPR